jgi:hypothetical protein
MLNFLTNTEGSLDNQISNVLQREYLNLIADFEVNSLNCKSANPDYSWLNVTNENIDDFLMNKNDESYVYNYNNEFNYGHSLSIDSIIQTQHMMPV